MAVVLIDCWLAILSGIVSMDASGAASSEMVDLSLLTMEKVFFVYNDRYNVVLCSLCYC